MAKLKWTDSDEIAFQLSEKYPDMDPLTVVFTDIRDLVSELEDFGEEPSAVNEKKLEAIQMAWLEYYKENQ